MIPQRRRAAQRDELTRRLVVVVWVCLLTGLQGHRRRVDRSWQAELARGSTLAALGCLRGATASVEQWRSIAGVGKRLASELARHCRHARCSASHPPQGVRGLGPVLSGRVGQMLCAELPIAPTASQATPSAATLAEGAVGGGLVELKGVVQHAHGQVRDLVRHDD